MEKIAITLYDIFGYLIDSGARRGKIKSQRPRHPSR
jgi:hypothetical protein